MASPDSDEQLHATEPEQSGGGRAASLDTVRLSHDEIAAQLRAAGVDEEVLDELAEKSENESSPAEKADDDD